MWILWALLIPPALIGLHWLAESGRAYWAHGCSMEEWDRILEKEIE